MRGRILRSRFLFTLFALLVVALALGFTLTPIQWRLLLIGRKLHGGESELTWGELLHMIGPASRYYLKPVITEGRSINAAIANPFDSKADETKGQEIYRTRCAVC